MTARRKLPILIVMARAFARKTIPASFWSVVDDGLRDDIHNRRARRGRLPTLWGALQYLLVGLRFAADRVIGERWADGLAGFLATSGWGMDTRAALRAIRSRPGVGLTIVWTIALAIGATTAVFSVVNGVLIQPLPYPEADRLARVWQTRPDWVESPNAALQAASNNLNLNYPTLEDWLLADTGFERLGAWVDAGYVLQGSDGAEVVRGQEATSGFFTSLGIAPIAGRFIEPADDEPGAEPVAVLGAAFWRSRFAGSRSVIGTTIVLNDVSHTVVGVMPDGFPGPTATAHAEMLPGSRPAVWTPLTDEATRGWKSVSVLGRLAPGVTVQDTESRIESIHAQLSVGYSEPEALRGIRVEGLLTSVVAEVRSTLWFLLGAVALVMLVAIVNIANVLVASGLTRRRDLAVRAAIGAGSGRLIRGLVLESVILSTAGGALGIALAYAGMPMLLRLLPSTLPRLDQVGMNSSVVVGGLLLTGVTALLVGAMPAVLAAKADPQEAMRESARGATANRNAVRLRGALVIVQIGLATVLLIGAGLLGTSFLRLWNVDRGFQTSGVVAVWIEPDPGEFDTREKEDDFLRVIEVGLEEIPGVQAAAANNLPLSGLSSGTTFRIEHVDGTTVEAHALLNVATPDFLDVLGIPLVSGRRFSVRDDAEAPRVGIVSETMASRYWPGENPIGQWFRFDDDATLLIEVVGVAADVPSGGLASPVDPMIYLPAPQTNRSTYEWVLRVREDVGHVLQEARRVVGEHSSATPITRVMILDDVIDESVAVPRIRMLLVLGLAGLAATLALVGVYGVLSFVVAQRTREIGVRMALGAHSDRVVADVIGHGLRLTVAGVVVGTAASWALSDLAGSFLFEVAPRQIAIYAVVGTAVLLLGFVAAWAPARRATRVDPVSVLSGD